MKTTVELPTPLLRQAKMYAAQHGLTLKDVFTDALAAHLAHANGSPARGPAEPPWRQAFGALRGLHKETQRINALIEQEFEVVEPEMWA